MKSEEFERLKTIGLVAYASAWCAKQERFNAFTSKLQDLVGPYSYSLFNHKDSHTSFWVVWDGKSILVEPTRHWGGEPYDTYIWFGAVENFDRSTCSYPHVDADCTCDVSDDECPACDLGEDWCETHSNYH